MSEETVVEMEWEDLIGLEVFSPKPRGMKRKFLGVVSEVIVNEYDAGWHNYKDFIVVGGERILASHIGQIFDNTILLEEW